MNKKRRLWLIIIVGMVITFIVSAFAYRLMTNCCKQVSPNELIGTFGPQENDAVKPFLEQTGTASYFVGLALTQTSRPIPYTANTPLITTVALLRDNSMDGLNTAVTVALTQTQQGTIKWIATITPTFTPIPYTADMSPTAVPPPSRTPTAKPTLCPPSDVVCPGGNATMSPADRVMMLMASASAPEFGQLAQTATALAITPTPSVHASNCAFSWAHQDLPDVAETAREAFSTISMASIQVIRADAYGENCNRADGSLSSFGAMTTDFYLSVNVSDLNDSTYLGQVVMTAYTVLSELKVKLPAQAGYLDIMFTAGSTSKDFRAMFPTIKHAIEAGKTGAELVALGE